jgi:hypothetical protein
MYSSAKAIDSVKDHLTQKLWVGTLGNSTDGFGPNLRDSINLRMCQLCASVPVWIPDAEFESCCDEFCHQVHRTLGFPSAKADLCDRCSEPSKAEPEPGLLGWAGPGTTLDSM